MKNYSTFKCHNIAILSTEAKKQRTQMIPEKENEQFMYLSAFRFQKGKFLHHGEAKLHQINIQEALKIYLKGQNLS